MTSFYGLYAHTLQALLLLFIDTVTDKVSAQVARFGRLCPDRISSNILAYHPKWVSSNPGWNKSPGCYFPALDSYPNPGSSSNSTRLVGHCMTACRIQAFRRGLP